MKQLLVGNQIVRRRLCLIALLFYLDCSSQVDTLSRIENGASPLVGQLVIEGYTIPWTVLDEVLFVPKPTLNNFQARRNYYLLTKKVRRVYPFVREAALRMDSVNIALKGIDRRRQRRLYTK